MAPPAATPTALRGPAHRLPPRPAGPRGPCPQGPFSFPGLTLPFFVLREASTEYGKAGSESTVARREGGAEWGGGELRLRRLGAGCGVRGPRQGRLPGQLTETVAGLLRVLRGKERLAARRGGSRGASALCPAGDPGGPASFFRCRGNPDPRPRSPWARSRTCRRQVEGGATAALRSTCGAHSLTESCSRLMRRIQRLKRKPPSWCGASSSR